MEECTMKKVLMTLIAICALVALQAAAARAARSHQELVDQAQAEMEKICGSMLPYLERPDDISGFKIEDEDVINAYADQNGEVHFYMGMINFFQSEDEFAAVCGHEMAHVSKEHIKKSTKTGILATVVSEVVGGTAGNIAGNLIYTKKSRSFERESDRRGLEYAWQAGFDPEAGIDLWEGMSRMGGSSGLEKYLSTHPVDSERIQNFKVTMYRDCLEGTMTRFCEEILADPALQQNFNDFESRN